MEYMKTIIRPAIREFLDFMRQQGIVSLAIGIIIGGAVTKLVTSFVTNLINPIVGIFLGRIGDLSRWVIPFFNTRIMIGNFVSALIDFTIIATVVYFGIKKLGLEKLDKPKEEK